VDVKGPIATLGTGERYIKNPTITPNGKGSVKPRLMTNLDLGGEDCAYNSGTGAGQQGIKDARGLNNIGLLVRVTGRVTFVGDTFFYIDDGSKLDDGSGNTGVRVLGMEVTMPGVGKYVILTGTSSCWKNGSNLQRQARPHPQVIKEY